MCENKQTGPGAEVRAMKKKSCGAGAILMKTNNSGAGAMSMKRRALELELCHFYDGSTGLLASDGFDAYILCHCISAIF